jgi:hypothetical protein
MAAPAGHRIENGEQNEKRKQDPRQPTARTAGVAGAIPDIRNACQLNLCVIGNFIGGGNRELEKPLGIFPLLKKLRSHAS